MAETKIASAINRLTKRRNATFIIAFVFSFGGLVEPISSVLSDHLTVSDSYVHTIDTVPTQNPSSMQVALKSVFSPAKWYGIPVKIAWDTKEQVILSKHSINAMHYYAQLDSATGASFGSGADVWLSYAVSHMDEETPKQDHLLFKYDHHTKELVITRRQKYGPITPFKLHSKASSDVFKADSWAAEFVAALGFIGAILLDINIRRLKRSHKLLDEAKRDATKSSVGIGYSKRIRKLRQQNSIGV